jgi:NAD(P)-dependent dehydrogenase (short-subunit alcohol dehydrogenase family)
LVNNAAAVFRDHLRAPGGFWEKPLDLCQMIDVGLRSSYVATYHVAPMMVAAERGLVVNISFSARPPISWIPPMGRQSRHRQDVV